ncbi:MAG TPA: hypothetical protein PLB18_21200, partial [Acidobacteriota bacterium]|nr:hypothetical protein [Acidobacteriota bacterium]
MWFLDAKPPVSASLGCPLWSNLPFLRLLFDSRIEKAIVYQIREIFGLDSYTMAANQFRTSGNHYFEAGVLIKIASINSSQGKYQIALNDFTTALSIARKLKDSSMEALILNGIGSV